MCLFLRYAACTCNRFLGRAGKKKTLNQKKWTESDPKSNQIFERVQNFDIKRTETELDLNRNILGTQIYLKLIYILQYIKFF